MCQYCLISTLSRQRRAVVVPTQQQQPPWELATNAESPAAPRAGESETLGVGPNNLSLKHPPGDYDAKYMLKFEYMCMLKFLT